MNPLMEYEDILKRGSSSSTTFASSFAHFSDFTAVTTDSLGECLAFNKRGDKKVQRHYDGSETPAASRSIEGMRPLVRSMRQFDPQE